MKDLLDAIDIVWSVMCHIGGFHEAAERAGKRIEERRLRPWPPIDSSMIPMKEEPRA